MLLRQIQASLVTGFAVTLVLTLCTAIAQVAQP